MTVLRGTKMPGFDELCLRCEPIEVPGDGVWRSFIAGPFIDATARRGGVVVEVKDWPAEQREQLVPALRSLLDASEKPKRSLKRRNR